MKKLLFVMMMSVALTCGAVDIDPRYCGEPKRTASGAIVRSASVLAAFQRIHPCPATGLTQGACPGWSKDHVISLACGGCDSVGNLQWLPTVLKAGSGTLPKDRWERRIYCGTGEIITMPESGRIHLENHK